MDSSVINRFFLIFFFFFSTANAIEFQGKFLQGYFILGKTNPDAKIMIIRPFNVLAPIQSHIVGFVFPRFFRAAYLGESLKVYGDGIQRRAKVSQLCP